MSIHRLNQLLPPAEIKTLQADDANNLNEIFRCLELLVKTDANQVDVDDILDSTAATKLFKLLQFRRSLKFQSDEAFYGKVLKSIYHAYIRKRATVSMKSVLLQMMNEICNIRKFKSTLEFPDYDWRVFWDQSISIVTRAKKTESISSGEALVDYLSKLCTFCHNARRFVSDDEVSKILNESMSKLVDTRQHTCVEGLIMLVNCLPNHTKHIDYDTLLPQWLVLWKSINFSPTWDVSWLTLLNRARYHTTIFDWSILTGWLMIKTKELLILPHNEPVHRDKMYRMEFQKYYTNMLPFGNQHRKLALCKVAKLLYFVTIIYPSLPPPAVNSSCDSGSATQATSLTLIKTLPITITPPTLSEDCLFSVSGSTYPGYNNTTSPVDIMTSANELSIFFQPLRYFLYASNSGNWTQNLAIFTMYMIGEMTRHVGVSFIQNVYSFSEDIKATIIKKHLSHLLSAVNGDDKRTATCGIHIPTIKYLCGLLTVVSLEGLFGKDQASSYVYASCLKNIICIDPQTGHIIMPFMLSALTVVNQSHQAPIALHTLTVCFRHLLYPVPVALSYLPELLQSLLPGLDTADRTKTFVTLHLIATILSWVPIQESYTAAAGSDTSGNGSSDNGAKSYLALIELATATGVTTTAASGITSPLTPLVKEAVSLQGQLDTLAAGFQDWIPQFLDKYFLLLEAREGKQASAGSGGGHNHSMRDHKGDGSLCEAIGYLFQAISATTQPVLRQVVESRVLEYFKKTTPINAAKIVGKVLEYMTVTSRGTNLKLTIDTFLDKDTLAIGNISSDKLAFRLRLICGAVRECNGSALVPLLSQLLPYTESLFTQHSEKPVRKAAHKVVKDILKGMTSIYPLTVTPTSTDTTASTAVSTVLGAPVPLQSVEWHIPSSETLTVAVQFLRQKTTAVISEVKNLLATMTASTVGATVDTTTAITASVSSSKKTSDDLSKTEDTIVYNLQILTKLLRGAAEVLVDECVDDYSSATGGGGGVIHVMGVDIDINTATSEVEVDDDGRVLTTARTVALAGLSTEDQVFLKQLRSVVLAFLTYVHQCLDAFATVSPAATTTAKSYASLGNSAAVRKAWLKLLTVVITRRSAWLRNADDGRKSLTINKEMDYGPVTKKIKHDLSALCGSQNYTALSSTVGALSGVSLSQQLVKNGKGGGVTNEHMMNNLCNLTYWKYHDASTNNAVNRVWVMYAKRQGEYAISSNKQHSLQHQQGIGNTGSGSNLRTQLLTALLSVAQLSSHEYDLVRQEAISTLSKLVSYYSVPYFLHHILLPLTHTLAVPGTTYPQAVGVLALLKSPRIMAKICNQWELSDTLLQVILRTPSMVASSVIERDKKERVMAMIGDVMVQYAKGFNHVPFISNIDRAQNVLSVALNTLSIDNATGISVSPSSAVTGGLRYESYAGYIVLHLIGHSNVQLTKGMWVWALRTVMNVRGQPTVFIAWSALVKLAYITYIKENNNNNNNNNSSSVANGSGTTTTTATRGTEIATLVYDMLFKDSAVSLSSTVTTGASVSSSSDEAALVATTAVASNAKNNNAWIDFLQGLSSCSGSNNNSGGGAQWSRGLLEIIHSAEYLRGTFPRKLFPSKEEPSTYSSHVVKENVGMFMSLFSYLHKHSNVSASAGTGDGNTSILSKATVLRLLEDSKRLKTASEDDARQNNAIRASLWSGLYRTVLLSLSFSTFTYEDELLGLEAVLAQFFIEQVDKISTDFCSDWAEAVMLALVVVFPKQLVATGVNKLKLVEYLMDGFETSLNDQTITATTITADITASSSSSSEDGFTRIDNRLLLAESLLQAELSTDYHARINNSGVDSNTSTTTAIIGHRMLSFLQQPHINLISPYRSTREHLATIVVILSQLNYAARTPLDVLWVKLSSDRAVTEELSATAVSSSDSNNNMDVNLSSTIAAGVVSADVIDLLKVSGSSNGNQQRHQQTRAQHILQFACHCLRYFAYESAANIEWVMPDILALMSLTVVGSGCSDMETAKTCHQTCIFVSITLKSFAAPSFASTTTASVTASSSSLTPLVELLKSHANHSSFHVRETVLLCSNIVMTNNWFTLTVTDKKTLKDVLAEGLVDVKPEVQVIAMGGMVSYLTAKPANDIARIAEAYIKNSDILAAREKKKRKLEKTASASATTTTTDKPDKVYVSTVMMVACLVLTFPYDMPPFLPALVTSFVKHKNTSVVQNTVMKVIQMFKRTHQDRWESDFKQAFTHEQLEDVQGAGAAHYFS